MVGQPYQFLHFMYLAARFISGDAPVVDFGGDHSPQVDKMSALSYKYIVGSSGHNCD